VLCLWFLISVYFRSLTAFFFVFLELQEDLSQLETTCSSPEKIQLCIPHSTPKEEKETKVLSHTDSLLELNFFSTGHFFCLCSIHLLCR
jgi:hypothetical protein